MRDSDLTRTALRALAKDGVNLFPIGPFGGSEFAHVPAEIRCVKSGRVLIGDVPWDGWSGWYEAGYIVASETDAGLRLAQAGRIHLKRLLSRGSPPDDAGRSGPATEPLPRPAIRGAVGRPEDRDGDGSPLDWLRRRRDKTGRALISAVEFSAGERLRSDFTLGQVGPRTTMSWSPVQGDGGGAWRDGELTLPERAAAARERFRRAMKAVGPDFANVLYDVCCAEIGLGDLEARSGWPRRSGKLVLQLALRALARHYGFAAGGAPFEQDG